MTEPDENQAPPDGTKQPKPLPPKDPIGESRNDQVRMRRALTGRQRAALGLAVGVGLTIVIVLVYLGRDLSLRSPAPPSLLGVPSGDLKEQLEAYAKISEIALARTTSLFTTIVASALLPVFTSIVGYLFGTGVGRNED